MKHFLALILFISTSALAQNSITVEKPLLCNWVPIIFESLKETYKEEPIWLGEDEKSRYTLFVNPDNGQFTIVQFNHEIACILGVGKSSFSIPSKPTL